jgi:serine/threonine protein kinase/Flp pilus assembly protein TadD
MHDAGNDRNSIRDLLALGLNESVEASQRLPHGVAVPAGQRAFAGFELLEQIGRGGMGIIYRARERATNRLVAVKMIATNLVGVEEVRLRFEREVRAAAALEHEHILRIYEVSEWGGIPYFSMQFAERGSLMDHLEDFTGKDPREIARLLIKIARGIQHAHGRNVIHRDLKPGNILLNAQGEPLIADFGLAQLLLDNPLPDLTGTLVVLGTPGYIAPELAQGNSTVAADIYGLGAILYHLLTGHRPFEGSNSFHSLTRAAAGPPLPVRRLKSAIPKQFETICDCCLQPDPSSRYTSAEDLGRDLERAIAGQSRLAARPRRKPKRRRKILAASGPVALALLLLWLRFGHYASRDLSRANHKRTEAEYFVDRARETLAREHSEPNLRSAEQLMRRALSLDPASVMIHAELSRVLSKIYWHISPEESVATEARSEAEFALHLNAKIAASHLAMADYHFRCRRDYPAALASLHEAEIIDPKDGSVPALAALVLKRLSRWDEALESSRRACALEPESAPRYYDLAATCDVLRRYPEAIAAIERAKYLAPDNPTHTLLHAWLLFRGQGDTSGLERIVATLPFEQEMAPQYFDTVFLWLLWSKHPRDALRLAQALPDDYAVRRYDAFLLKPYFVGLACRGAGDRAQAAAAFETVREILEARERAQSEDARVHSQLGIVYAALDRIEDAVREGRRAVELLPLDRDPVGGSYVAAQLAEIYSSVGQIDAAVALIEDLLGRPGHLTIHELKVDPRWDPLRNDMRFRRLVADKSLEK